jgi:hypothetical protein
MAIDQRDALVMKKDCYFLPDIKLISLECRICMNKCEIGEQIVKCIDQVENDEYHHKFETE